MPSSSEESEHKESKLLEGIWNWKVTKFKCDANEHEQNVEEFLGFDKREKQSQYQPKYRTFFD